VIDKVPAELRNRLGIAIGMRTYRAHCELLETKRWRDLAAAGARKQRMLWASTRRQGPECAGGSLCERIRGPRDHRYHA